MSGARRGFLLDDVLIGSGSGRGSGSLVYVIIFASLFSNSRNSSALSGLTSSIKKSSVLLASLIALERVSSRGNRVALCSYTIYVSILKSIILLFIY